MQPEAKGVNDHCLLFISRGACLQDSESPVSNLKAAVNYACGLRGGKTEPNHLCAWPHFRNFHFVFLFPYLEQRENMKEAILFLLNLACSLQAGPKELQYV